MLPVYIKVRHTYLEERHSVFAFCTFVFREQQTGSVRHLCSWKVARCSQKHPPPSRRQMQRLRNEQNNVPAAGHRCSPSSCFSNRLQALSLVLLIPFLTYSSRVIVSSCCTETLCCSATVTFTSKTNTSHLHKHNSGSRSSAGPDCRWAVGGEQPRAEV